MFFIPAVTTVGGTEENPSYSSVSVLQPIMREVQEVVTQAVNEESETTTQDHNSELSHMGM